MKHYYCIMLCTMALTLVACNHTSKQTDGSNSMQDNSNGFEEQICDNLQDDLIEQYAPQGVNIVNEKLNVLLGEFQSTNDPDKDISRINKKNFYDCDTWRLPTTEELMLLKEKGYADKNKVYMSIDASTYNMFLEADRINLDSLKNDLQRGRCPRRLLPRYILDSYIINEDGCIILVSDGKRLEHDIICDSIGIVWRQVEENWQEKHK